MTCLDRLKGFLKTVLPAPAARVLRKLYWRIKGDVYSEEDFLRLLERRAKKLPPVSGGPPISILCCVWNTPEEYLHAMLDSIRGQTYRNWELLIDNCSDGEHSAVGGILREASLDDARIKVFDLPNRGIAANSNAVSKYASGEFVMLMDHDDLLMPDALEKLAEAQQREGSDFVYADEYVLQMEFGRIWRCRKKAFTMEALEADNFINHPVLIRRQLFESVGGFRSGFEGSQDHDLYFRLLEKTERISYVAVPLYVWRINAGSFSNRNLDRCIESGKRAVAEHLQRTNRSGTVVSAGRTTQYLIVDERPADAEDPPDRRP